MKVNPRAKPTTEQLRRGTMRGTRDRAIRASQKRERAVAPEREQHLDSARRKCATDRAKTTDQCERRRDRIRTKARGAIKAEKLKRQGARQRYRTDTGIAGPPLQKAKRLTRAESDSLAEHSIPDDLLFLWPRERSRFSYSMAPDARAEAFAEWAELHPADVEQARSAHFEDAYTDSFFAKQERQRYEEAAPF